MRNLRWERFSYWSNARCAMAPKPIPGKAPKLQPHRYKPDFVWDRLHNGFRNMPALKDLYSPEQEIAIVAYVRDEFWP